MMATGTKGKDEGDGGARGSEKKRLCREYALLLLMPPRPCPRPHPAIPLLPSYHRWPRSCGSASRKEGRIVCFQERCAYRWICRGNEVSATSK